MNSQAADGATALHQVAGEWVGQPAIVRLLLDRGARPNLADKEGKTALMIAAARGKTGIVTLLRARGADARLKDAHGRTALDLAADGGYLETAELLAAGETEAVTRTASRKAHDQALLRHIEAAEFAEAAKALAQGADANAGRDEGAPALVLAAGNSEGNALVRQLLEKGATVNRPARDGTTALMAAAAHFNLPLCQLLVAHRAALEARDAPRQYRAPPRRGCRHRGYGGTFSPGAVVPRPGRQPDRCKRRRSNGSHAGRAPRRNSGYRDPARPWSRRQQPGSRRQDRPDDRRSTCARSSAVELLLDHDADVNARDKAGRSVLLVSVDAADRFSYQDQEKYSFEIFRLLLQRGAKADVADGQGNTPLLVARRRGYKDTVALLEGK